MTSFIDDNGQVLDYSGADFGLTKQVGTWIDFKIAGDVSLDFTIPNTAKNRDVLGYYGAQQIDPPTSVTFNVIRNGNFFSRGQIIIRGHDEDKINCFYISGNANWFNALSFNLKEIDFQDKYTIAADSMDTQKSNTEGLIYPVVDWWAQNKHRSTFFLQLANDRQNGFPNFSEFHPCLYLSTLVTEMCTYGGIKITGDLITDPLFKKIVITPDGPDLFWPDWEINRSRVKCFLQFPGYSYVEASDPQPVRWGAVETGASLFDQNNYSILIARTGTYRVSQNMYCGTVGISFLQYLYVNGVNVMSLPAFGNSLNYEFIYNFNKGDYVQIYVDRNTGSGNYRLNRATPANESNITLELLKPVGTDSTADYIGSFTDVVIKVPPVAVAPNMKGTELIKFLCMYFGAVCYFDEFSKTLTINKVSRFQKSLAEDWSAYFVSQKNTIQNVAQHNYIKFSESDEDGIKNYNESVKKGYGGGDIQTANETTFERDIYRLPFGASWDEETTTYINWFMPYIKFYDLQFDESVAYSGVTSYIDVSGATLAKFTSTFSSDINTSCVFFVKSNSGKYHGFHVCNSSDTANTNPILGTMYDTNDSGTISKYSVSKVSGPPRLLVCHPAKSISDAGGSNYYTPTFAGGATTKTTAPLAWFDKPLMDLPIDVIKDSLAIDNVGVRTYNNTVGERYHNFLERIYNNPKIDAVFLLPVKVLQGFDFSKYIYLETKDLTGYFFVNKITDYKDAETPVKVELLYVD